MIIYYIDFDNLKVIDKEFGDIFNQESFFRELDEMFSEYWFECESYAYEYLQDIVLDENLKNNA